MNALIESKLKQLPKNPGVYLMKDAQNTIIYIGKAINLRNRVRSYFRSQPKEAVKTKALVRHIEDFEYVIVDNESEALVLECNLIKKYQPRYNINLKDGKTYPYVRITNDKWPRIFVTRHVQRDGSRYFGPYTNVNELRETLDLLHKIYPWRNCSNTRFNQQNPCLNAHINLCIAPCIHAEKHQAYLDIIQSVVQFFSGQSEGLVKALNEKMLLAADALEFEKASTYRDQMQAIKKLGNKQKAVLSQDDDRDVIAMARNDIWAIVQVFFIRGGKILGRESYPIKSDQSHDDCDILSNFLTQFYLSQENMAQSIYLPFLVDDLTVLNQLLNEKHERTISFIVPKRGTNKALLEMVQQNAQEALDKRVLSQSESSMRTDHALEDLAKYLGLPIPPRRIECYDISNTQGTNSVASMVVFIDGRASKDLYRRFKINTVEGPNDFLSIYEVIHRRFQRLKTIGKKADQSFNDVPDLVIIDGGKGQLSYARKAMHELDFSHIPTFGLAKEEELLFKENAELPIRIAHDMPALYLLQRLRDETHRFAITYHRSLRGKKQLASILEDINGVGKKRRLSLLTHFGSFSRILNASIDELASVPGISPTLAEEIHAYLKTHDDLQARLKQHRRND